MSAPQRQSVKGRPSATRDLTRNALGPVVSVILLMTACSLPGDALDQVLASGVLRVGMDASFPPFEYSDERGVLVGFDVDLARELASRLGQAQGQRLEVRLVANLSYDGLYDALSADQVDVVISALYADPTRMADFAYSVPYFNAGQVLVVGPEAEGVEGMQDLAGRVLAVELGSEGDVEARAWERRLVGLTVLPCQSADEVLARLVAHDADAALVDHLSALGWAEGDLRIVGPPVTDEPYAVAVRRKDRALLEAINLALAQMEQDGTLEQLRQRWFLAAP